MSDDGEKQRQIRDVMSRVQPADNELPAVLPLMISLGRTAAAAVQLTSLEVYSAALLVVVDVRTRAGRRLPVMGPVEAVDGGLLSPNGEHRLIVTCEDGVVVDSWTHRYPQPGDMEAANQNRLTAEQMTIFVTGHGGGSEERGYQRRISYWVTPRPHGALVLTFEWTVLGIGPTRVAVSADEVARALAQTTRLWD